MSRRHSTRLLLLALALGGVAAWTRMDAPVQSPRVTAHVAAPPPAPAVAPPERTTQVPSPAIRADAPATAPGRGIVGEWTGPAPASLLQIARARTAENAPPIMRIPLRLNARREGVMRIDDYRPTEEDGGVFVGTMEGLPGTTVVMSYVGRAQAGVVLIPAEHRAYDFRAGDDGVLRVTELDTLLAPGCGEPGNPLHPPGT